MTGIISIFRLSADADARQWKRVMIAWRLIQPDQHHITTIAPVPKS
jgi:hypothetical protein